MLIVKGGDFEVQIHQDSFIYYLNAEKGIDVFREFKDIPEENRKELIEWIERLKTLAGLFPIFENG